MITSEDIDFILERVKDCPSIIFVPARDKLGTNAFLRKPPNAIPSLFGHDSFNKHKDEADRSGIPHESYENPRIALDIDNPDDLKEFMFQKSNTKAYDQLMKLNIVKKLDSMDELII